MPEASIPIESHPSLDQLSAFGRGEIDATLAEAIERHLADCPDCLERLESTTSDDPWLTLLRVAGPSGMDSDGPRADGLVPPSGYQLEAVIGRGGMGVVHRARQLGLDRKVALKTVAAGSDASPQVLDRFRREAEAVASLNHPAIVPIHDVGVRDGAPFYAMELLEGGSLADRLLAGPLRPREAAALVERLARAVDHAHRQGIVHRDLKPSNILFTADGFAKVADFGLAKRLDVATDAQTRSGMLLGTPSYMAPEQAAGRTGDVGPAADIHALGALLFECLTGRPPFLASNPIETLDLIREAEPPSPRRLRPGIPPDLETICLKCLEKDPASRFGSAALLGDDLARFARGESILARPASTLDRSVKWARRRPAEAALALLTGIAALATITGLLIHQSRLQAALDREQQAAREAQRQRGIAESNYRDAREALGRVLAALNDPKFAGNPRLVELHRDQAEAALSFYDRVLSQTGSDDPAVIRDTAAAAVEAANLQITLGREAPAEQNLRRAQQLLDDLLAADPDNPALLREQMIAHIKLGVLKMGVDTDVSIAALERARTLAEHRADLPNVNRVDSRKDLAWVEHDLGSAWQRDNHPDRALPHYQHAIPLYEEALAAAPDDPGLAVELAQTLVNTGLAHAALQAYAAAAADFERADRLLDQALASRPGTREYVASKCDLQINWGNLEVALGHVDSAIERFTHALNDLKPFLDAEPNVMRLKETAFNLHGSRAQALEKAGRHPEAVADWDRVIALATQTDSTPYRLSRLLCQARSGDYPSVMIEAANLERDAKLAPADTYNLACAYALAATAAPAASLENSELRSQALRLVAQALGADPNLRETARHDADLALIATDEGFLKALDPP